MLNVPVKSSSLADVKLKTKYLNLLKDYVVKGGFPETVNTDIDSRNYLSTLFECI